MEHETCNVCCMLQRVLCPSIWVNIGTTKLNLLTWFDFEIALPETCCNWQQDFSDAFPALRYSHWLTSFFWVFSQANEVGSNAQQSLRKYPLTSKTTCSKLVWYIHTQFPTEISDNNEPSVNRLYVATVGSCHASLCPMERDLHRPLAASPMALTSLIPSMRLTQRTRSKPRGNSIRQSQANHRWPDARKMTIHTSRLAKRQHGHLPDYIGVKTISMSPAKTFIFSFMLCLTAGPREWLRNPDTIRNLEYHHADISLSNASSNSSNITTARFIFFKHFTITPQFFYLKELQRKLSPTEPFFDISLNRKTPTGKTVPHLIDKCGENDVGALTEILST